MKTPVFLFLSFVFCVSFVSAEDTDTPYYPADLLWTATDSSKEKYYDFVGSMVYCKPHNAQFGYRDAKLKDGPCTSPGPTIRMISGYNYLFYLEIGADVEPELSKLASPRTNIHTHGLMISGSSNADDISRSVSIKEECIAYNWTVLHEHAGGLCWYHAHAHGSTDGQVSQGAYGALIIEDRDSKGNWPQFPEPDATGLQTLCDKKHERIMYMANIDGEWHLNGKVNGNELLAIEHSTWYRLRLLVSQPAGTRVNPWYLTNALKKVNRCEFRNMAYDGHWRSSIPSDSVVHWNISASGRMDVAFRCPKTEEGKVHEIIVALQNPRVAMKIVVKGSNGPASVSSPYYDGKPWVSHLPPWQQDLGHVKPDREHAVALTPSSVKYDDSESSYNALTPTATYNYGDVVQFTLSGTATHPFHLHIYPMQVISGCGPHEVGEFYDTISATDTEKECIVRYWIRGEPGKAVMHCHLLRHEDNGAMTWIQVEGGPDLAEEPFPPIDSCYVDEMEALV